MISSTTQEPEQPLQAAPVSDTQIKQAARKFLSDKISDERWKKVDEKIESGGYRVLNRPMRRRIASEMNLVWSHFCSLEKAGKIKAVAKEMFGANHSN